MQKLLIYSMLYIGIVLMVWNIIQYVRFARHIQKRGDWQQEKSALNIPIILLVLFLAGYIAVTLIGYPDLIVAGILFGGSIFVAVILSLIRRIADRIVENERLESRLTAAEEANRAKTFFLSNMSHDIRTPLNAIIGYTSLANQGAASEEKMREYLGKIERAGHQLLAIVNDVLEMSRIESGKVELFPENINLSEAAGQVYDVMLSQMTEKGIHFTLKCDLKNEWVLCDKNQIDRALMNILGNACKFTQKGGTVSFQVWQAGAGESGAEEAVSITESIQGAETKTGKIATEVPEARSTEPEKAIAGTEQTSRETDFGKYFFRIADNGIGMSQEFAEHIFIPFERERTSTVSKTQGTGLGMAITKNIVEMMGGEITVQSEQGKGTVFLISLELPITSEGEAKEKAAEQKDFSRHRVLLVEDNEVNREIAILILSQTGFEVETAEDGQEAVDTVSKSAPGYYDLILMDIQMPVMDGYTAAGKIRALKEPRLAEIPIIAMTANAFKEDEEAAAAAGMQGHIAKPLDIEKMMETIGEILGN